MSRTKKILTYVGTSVAVLYLILILIAYLPHETIPVHNLAKEQDQFITVDNNAIHFTKHGSGQPIILVHGFAGSIYTWRKLIPLLSSNFTVYTVDLLGFGLSDKPADGNYTLAAQGELLLKFMDALNIPSAVLVGHSMGGVVVAYAGTKEPAKVNALILISPGFYGKGAPAFLKYLFFPLNRIMARQFYTKSVRAQNLTRYFYDKSLLNDEIINEYLLPAKTPGAVEALEHMMATVTTQTYEDAVRYITQPTLIVWGEKDQANLPADGKRLKRDIKNSSLVYIPECGHYVQEEKPAQLAHVIKEFFNNNERPEHRG